MNEGKKTGVFWMAAVVTTTVATFVSLPNSTETTEENLPGTILFQNFNDPTVATSMQIITFDDEQGQIETFEVRKDRANGLWTIPSREGYPADAIEQMRDAANSLVDVKILDVQTSNAEDHDDLGVVEPKIEKLEVGDEGVGRLVVFKDEKGNTLASLIIGSPVKDDPSKRYVRVPNQAPVFVVKFDDAPLTTKFTDWIEDDLLQMSSIDIDDVEIKDYTATLGGQGISLARNFTAKIDQDGTDWKLEELFEFDPENALAEPQKVEPEEGEQLDVTKLNEMKNALDDLKIVGVFRKPEGVSATLKASEDLIKNQDAVTSLAQRGFYPVDMGPNGEADILSASGEMSVSLQDGVQYLLRFGNTARMTTEQEKEEGEEDGQSKGENRYLFVTTQVDESKFPAPQLKPIPQTLEELDALLNPKAPQSEAAQPESVTANGDSESSEKQQPEPAETDKAMIDGDLDAKQADQEMTEEAIPQPSKEETDPSPEDPGPQDAARESASNETAAPETAAEGATEVTGAGEAAGTGQAQKQPEQEATEAEADAKESSLGEGSANEKPAMESEEDTISKDQDAGDDEELTEEEKLELLEAEQEKITKENQRKIDARNDKLKAAQERVDELNERFADWYYVIPESTFTQLQITREELFKSEETADGTAADPLPGGPQMKLPNFLPGATP